MQAVPTVSDWPAPELAGSGGKRAEIGDAGADFRKAEADYGAGWYAAICADIWGTRA